MVRSGRDGNSPVVRRPLRSARCGAGARIRGWIVLSILLSLLIGSAGAVQESAKPSPSAGQTVQEWTERFHTAEQAFREGRWEQAVPALRQLIRDIETTRMVRSLTDEERQIYERTLDYLGRYALQVGRPGEARIYYTILLQTNPRYTFPDTPPPEVAAFFEELRSQTIGHLSLQVQVPDAEIFLYDEKVGTGVLREHPLVAGTYQLRIERPGYAPYQKLLTIRGGQHLDLGTIELERTTGIVFVATAPAGVIVRMDGQPVGVTGGKAPEDVRSYAEIRGWPPDAFSDYLAIPVENGGEHILEFEKPCYASVQVIVRTAPLQDVYVEPVRLKPALGRIRLQANGMADVFIDGDRAGDTRDGQFTVCAGSHVIAVQNTWSAWQKEVVVVTDEILDLRVDLKPRIVFLGSVIDPGGSKVIHAEAVQHLQKVTAQLRHTEWVVPPQNETSLNPQTAAMELFRTWQNGDRAGWQHRIRSLVAHYRARMFALLHVPYETAPQHVDFLLFSDLAMEPDRIRIDVNDANAWTALQNALDREDTLHVPLLPIQVAWTTDATYPTLFWFDVQTLRGVDPLPRAGDRIYSIQGIQLDSPQALRKAYAALRPDARVPVQFGPPEGGQIRVVELPVIMTPIEPRLRNGIDLWHRKAFGYLRWAEFPGKDSRTAIARLNLARVLMHFHEWRSALEWLQRVKLRRPRGIREGTVRYYMAECYFELGLPGEAREILNALLDDRTSTVEHDLGPAVHDLAQELLSLIEQ